MSKLRDLLEEMIENEALEDRREYEVIDLISAYHLTEEEGRDLKFLISREFDTSHIGSIDTIDAEVIKEYLQESIHEDWEGPYTEHDRITLIGLIDDIIRYSNHSS
jgi:hypothetical protein